MKILINRLFALTALVLCISLLATMGIDGLASCALITFSGMAVLAGSSSWLRGQVGAAPDTNDVASALNLSEILDAAIESFTRTIMPLTIFATTFRNVVLRGNDTVDVRYYPLQGITSKDYNGQYNSSSSTGKGSMTDVRPIQVNRRKFQLLEVTGYTLARIPMFDAQRMGRLKGEKLAFDVINDILSIVTSANYPGLAFTGAAATFDADNVVDIRTACNKATTGPNVVTDGVTTAGSTTVTSATALFTLGDIGVPISGAGIPAGTFIDGIPDADTLNGASSASAILSQAATADGAAVHFTMVRPVVPWPETGRGLILNPDYDGALLKDHDFRRDLTVAQSRVAETGRLPNVYGFDYAQSAAVPSISNLVGMATYMSAILAAFSPIEPPPAARELMTQYEIVTDPATGISLEYRVWGDPNSDKENHVIECNYGFAPGEKMAIQRIVSA